MNASLDQVGNFWRTKSDYYLGSSSFNDLRQLSQAEKPTSDGIKEHYFVGSLPQGPVLNPKELRFEKVPVPDEEVSTTHVSRPSKHISNAYPDQSRIKVAGHFHPPNYGYFNPKRHSLNEKVHHNSQEHMSIPTDPDFDEFGRAHENDYQRVLRDCGGSLRQSPLILSTYGGIRVYGSLGDEVSGYPVNWGGAFDNRIEPNYDIDDNFIFDNFDKK